MTEPSPEGVLIRLARESIRPRKMSIRGAARRAGISETYWRNVESGREMRGGVEIPVRASAPTLASMAAVVGVSAAELERAGRGDAALLLREAERRLAEQAESTISPDLMRQIDGLSDDEAAYVIRRLSGRGGPDYPDDEDRPRRRAG